MKHFKKVLSLALCVVLAVVLMNGSALTTDAAKIDELKGISAEKKKEYEAATARVNELMAKIVENNNRMDEIKASISENEKIIEESTTKIEEDKEAFKKRLRSIYMSNSESRIKVLLGAESFSQFLQLSQLTASVSAYDKKMMEDLAEEIRVQEEKKKENEALLAEQEEKKKVLDEQYSELADQQAKAKAAYDSAEHDVEAEKERMRREEEAQRQRANGYSGSASAPSFSGSAVFLWPSDYTYISAGYQSNDSVHNGNHKGVDIAGGGIMGKPIYAIGDGYVTYVANYCTHNWPKSYGCGCGGNYGNYAQISHGTVNGNTYSAIYAHATNIIVSAGQYVSKGQVIGYVGTTGWSTGPHLHFGLYRNGVFINPLAISYAYR